MVTVAAYARVSTDRQAESQTIEQQVEQLCAYAQQQGWRLPNEQIYRDDGQSGARLDRPALDRLRDAVTGGAIDLVLITSPDRLARRYAYQVWLLEEFERAGCRVEFLERPLTGDPQDALVIQIRGAVAEYERTVIADRMRRGPSRRCVPVGWCRGRCHPSVTSRTRIARATRPEYRSTKARRPWYDRSSPGTSRTG